MGERQPSKAYPLDGLMTLPEGEGHYLYNLRIIPTVEKPLYGPARHNYEFAFQESLHKVRETASSLFCDALPSIAMPRMDVKTRTHTQRPLLLSPF